MKCLTATLTSLDGADPESGPLQALLDHIDCSHLDLWHSTEELDQAIALESRLRSERPNLAVRLVGWPTGDNGGGQILRDAILRRLEVDHVRFGDVVGLAPAWSPISQALWLLAADGVAMNEVFVVERHDTAATFALQQLRFRSDRVRESPTQYGSNPVSYPSDPTAVARQLGIQGDNEAIHRAIHDAATLAAHRVPILIRGETGTGKGLVAQLIHALGEPAEGPFVPVNCAALPETLVESILFGHVKGAFSGATQDKPGKFEQADGGTLFLDELGELPLSLQAKLLTVLDDGLVERVGANQPKRVDIRLVTATNRDLEAAVAAGEFREDLYYRVSFGVISLPPLRQRREDIALLALAILRKFNQRLTEPRVLSDAAMDWLRDRDWPGNVRDLQNVLGRAALLSGSGEISVSDLERHVSPSPAVPPDRVPQLTPGFSLEQHLATVRSELIERALELAAGSQSGAARLLGISPQAVHKYIKQKDAS